MKDFDAGKLGALLATVVAVAAMSGRAIAAPTPLVPDSFPLPEDGRRFDGAVAVNVTIDVPSLRLTRPKQIISIEGLMQLLSVPPEAVAAVVGGDSMVFPAIEVEIRDWPTLIYRPGLIMDWSLSVPAEVFGTIPMTIIASAPPEYATQWSREYSALIKGAVEQSLVASGLFPRIAGGAPDYRVDVWIEAYEPTMPKMGFGAFEADVLSIWRLTRAGDGAVLACDFVDAHGYWRQSGLGPAMRAFHVAVQDMIGKGLAGFAGPSRGQRAALEPACLGRKGADGQWPAASAEWSERVRRNWPRLRAGMSVDEVAAAIGPVRVASDRLERTYVVPMCTLQFVAVRKKKTIFDRSNPTMQGLGLLEFVEYRTDLYRLVFAAKRMTRWHADLQECRIELASPPGLLIWQLSDQQRATSIP